MSGRLALDLQWSRVFFDAKQPYIVAVFCEIMTCGNCVLSGLVIFVTDDRK